MVLYIEELLNPRLRDRPEPREELRFESEEEVAPRSLLLVGYRASAASGFQGQSLARRAVLEACIPSSKFSTWKTKPCGRRCLYSGLAASCSFLD